MIALQLTLFAAISSLGPGLANQSITGPSLSPPHCVSLPLPPPFPCMLAKRNRRKNLKLLTTQMHRKAQFPHVLRGGRRAKRSFRYVRELLVRSKRKYLYLSLNSRVLIQDSLLYIRCKSIILCPSSAAGASPPLSERVFSLL